MALRAPMMGNTVHAYIGTWGEGRATASSNTIDLVHFPLLPGQTAPSGLTAADVGMPVMIVGAGPVDPLMPDIFYVQGGTLVSTITAVLSSTSFTIADPVVTSIYNVGFYNIAVFRRAGMRTDSWSYKSSIAQATRDQFAFTTLETDAYLQRFEVILEGQPVYVKSTDTETGEIFGGLIDALSVSNQPTAGGGGLSPALCASSDKPFAYISKCASWDSIAFRRRVNVVFARTITGPPGVVFNTVALLVASDEGLTVYADSGGDDITLQVPAGARLSDLFDQICTLARTPTITWYWKFDPWRGVVFRKKTTVPAPWDVDEDAGSGDNVLVSCSSEKTHDQMSNFVQAVGAQVLLGALTATFQGDDATRNFQCARPIFKDPVMELNGVGQTVGIAGVDTGKQWYYTPTTPDVLQDSGGTPMSPTDRLVVFTSPAVKACAQAINNAGLFEAAKSEGPGAQYDGNVTIQDVITSDELYFAAQQVAGQNGSKPQSVLLTTVRGGLATGQLQHIKIAAANVDNDYLITQLNMSSQDDAVYFEYTGLNGYSVPDWITAFTAFINREKNSVAITQPQVPIVLGSNPAVAPNIAVGPAILAFPNPVTAGNLLVVVAASASLSDQGDPISVSDTLGNTWVEVVHEVVGGFPNPLRLAIAYAFANSSGSTTVTVVGGGELILSEYSGMDSTSPVDTSGHGLTVPTLTTTGPAIVVTAVSGRNAIGSVTPPEQLIGFYFNVAYGDGTSAACDVLSTAQTFTSSLVPGATGLSPIWCSVAFRVSSGSMPPTPTIEVAGNPSGTVTHSGGALTSNQPVFGAGGGDVKPGTKTGTTIDVVTSDGSVSDQAVLIYDADGNATGLALGTDGQVLKVVSGAVAWGTGGGGGGGALVLLESHTATASAELDFVAWRDDSLYGEYMIEFVGLVSDTPVIQFSIDGGATYDTSSNYAYNGGFSYNGGTGQYGSNSTTAFAFRNGNTTLSTYGSWNGSLKLFGVSLLTWPSIVGQVQWNDGALGIVTVQLTANFNNILGLMNAFRVLPLSGLLASGTVRVYGLTK